MKKAGRLKTCHFKGKQWMSRKQIEDAAKRGDKMPDGLTLVEQLFFQAIANLTQRFLIGKISKAQSKVEYTQIAQEYESHCSKILYQSRLAAIWADIENAALKYDNEPTIENADRLRDFIFGKREFERRNEGQNG